MEILAEKEACYQLQDFICIKFDLETGIAQPSYFFQP